MVKTSNRLLTLDHEEAPWFRPEGKGTFMSSPAVKESAEARIDGGARQIVIDLEACTGMDSTFMGMLAGLAKVLKKVGGSLEIVGTSDKNRHSLEELGLNAMMEISEDRPDHAEIRKGYVLVSGEQAPGKEDHILECHENLCDADERNEKTFKSVLEVLRNKSS